MPFLSSFLCRVPHTLSHMLTYSRTPTLSHITHSPTLTLTHTLTRSHTLTHTQSCCIYGGRRFKCSLKFSVCVACPSSSHVSLLWLHVYPCPQQRIRTSWVFSIPLSPHLYVRLAIICLCIIHLSRLHYLSVIYLSVYRPPIRKQTWTAILVLYG